MIIVLILYRDNNYDLIGAGSSSNWCADTYRGGSANSENEAKAVIGAVAETGRVVSYLSIHSYSQLLLVPYAYSTVKAPDYDELVTVNSPCHFLQALLIFHHCRHHYHRHRYHHHKLR